MSDTSVDKILKIFTDVYPGLLAYVDKDLINRFVNETYLNWIGRPIEEIVGQHTRDVVGEEFFKKRLPFMERVLKGEELKFRTTLMHYKLGERHVEQIYRPDFDKNGSVRGFFVMVYDIDDQISEINHLQESERIFRNYLEMIPHLAFILDPSGQVKYFNERWYEFTGQTKGMVQDFDPKTLVHPDDLTKATEECLISLVKETPFELEYRLRRSDGEYRWHLCRCVAIRDGQDKITHWVGTNTDIHENKEIEINQQRLIKVLETSSDIIGFANNNGEVIYINQSGRKALELEENYKGKRIEDLIHPEDLPHFNQNLLPVLIECGKIDTDIRLKREKSRMSIPVNLSGFITTSDLTGEQTGLAMISRDMGEMKMKEKKLEEALQSRDQFLSMASHELKTPLTSLKLQAEITLRQLNANKPISPERQFIMAHQTNQLVSRLTRLIDDMLDVSRIRTGKLKIDKSNHELGDIVREVVFRMCALFEAGGLNMPSIFIEEKIFGMWDRFRLEQVLGNLLTNAIRYGRGNPIEIRAMKKNNYAVISVTDRGYGIAKEDINRIFDRFERAIHCSEVSGMGLGLFISKEIIEAHGGEIWVESEMDQGSTFSFSIPL